MAANQDVVNIHGTDYTLIAARLRQFREDHPEWSIVTKLALNGDMVRCKVKVKNKEGRTIATGHAEEDRSLGNINSTSAVENCETSAVGRALAFVSGEYAGGTIRSADEMADALKQQSDKRLYAEWTKHTEYVERYREGLENIRDRLADNDFEAAREAWNTLENENIGSEENKAAQMVLWRATTKGGWFTPRERQQMKYWSNDFEVNK